MAVRRVFVLGAGGQLGRKVCEVFGSRQWMTFGADSHAAATATKVLTMTKGADAASQTVALQTQIKAALGDSRLDAVVNVAGGFAMGSASDEEVVASTQQMVESSVYSSVMAARLASELLRPGGLLILPGAAAALGPTGWSLPYGASKAAVHHIVRSLADADAAGLPASVRTIGLAPQVLDTPQNRAGMPDVDPSGWASLDEVAEQLEAWCSQPEAVQSGLVYVVKKEPGQAATFEPEAPL